MTATMKVTNLQNESSATPNIVLNADGTTTIAGTTATALTTSGNLTFTGTGNRITGDFSNGTQSNRVMFQTNTANSNTSVTAIPNGTGTIAAFNVFGSSDPNNSSYGQLRVATASSTVDIISGTVGTATSFPITFHTGGGERLRLDTAGNLGLGVTPSAWKSNYKAAQVANGLGLVGRTDGLQGYLSSNWYVNSSNQDIYVATGFATIYAQNGGTHQWFTAPSGTAGNAISFTQAMTLSASGDLAIGTASPINSANYKTFTVAGTNGGQIALVAGSSPHAYLYSTSSAPFIFYNAIGASESARIDSSGNLLVSKTSAAIGNLGFMVQPTGLLYATVSSGANTYHVYSATSSTYRFYVAENGGIYNFSGNNVNLSDERTKKNIELSGSYLDKICAIPVKLFNYKDEAEGEQRTLGVIAQDVETVAPEFVNNDGWEGTSPEDGVPLKTLYTTDMMFGMMKAIQELKAEVDSLKAQLQGAA